MEGIGLIALDDSSNQAHEFYIIDEFYRELIDAFERAEALLESSRISHISLVRALITCGMLKKEERPSTTQAKDLKQAQEIVKGFMGSSFNLDCLGKWHNKKQSAFNALTKQMDGMFYTFVGTVDWENNDRYW